MAFRDTTAAVARYRTQVAEQLALNGLAASGGAKGRLVETSGFGPNPGALRMLTYAPKSLQAGAPLVVVLHGCTQTAEGYAAGAGWITLADRLGFALLCPEQSAANNPNRCFNWFEPGDIERGAGEAASIRQMVRRAIETHRCDPPRVYVTGLSAGGAMAAVMLATYPEVFAAGGVVAGLPYGAAESMNEAFVAMFQGGSRSGTAWGERVRKASSHAGRWPKLSIWHGDADTTVKPSNAVELAKQWANLHGLAAAPTQVQHLRGATRSVWTSAQGEPLIESYLVPGLAHGTSLATGGPEGLGAAGPFLIETGVSSSLEMARFWGLAPPGVVRTLSEDAIDASNVEQPPPATAPQGPVHAVLDKLAPVFASPVGAEIKTTITKALSAAGLLK